jgi:hypothetical protein
MFCRLILGVVSIAITTVVGAANVRIDQGTQHASCNAAFAKARGLPARAFWNGEWRQAFSTVRWVEDSYRTLTASGREEDVPFTYATVDIDNDAKPDVVIRDTTMFRGVNFDVMYVVPEHEFQAANEQKRVRQLLETAPQLNPGNAVRFADGSDGVPVETEIWRDGRTTYVVLKEHFFLKRRVHLPSSLFVARILGRFPSKGKGEPGGLTIELICRMVGT